MRFKTKFTPLGGITSKYKKGEVIFESSVAGTYDFESVGCTCEISVIGAGGGAAGTQSSNACAASAGASGSGFIGIVKLPKGHIYLTIGAGGASQCWLDGNCYGSAGGNSIIKILEQPIISCAGGGGGHTWWRSGASPAALGAMPVIGIDVVGTPILNRQGNTGTNYNSGPGGPVLLQAQCMAKAVTQQVGVMVYRLSPEKMDISKLNLLNNKKGSNEKKMNILGLCFNVSNGF